MDVFWIFPNIRYQNRITHVGNDRRKQWVFLDSSPFICENDDVAI